MALFKDKTAVLNESIKSFNRYHADLKYSHDSCKERILSDWVEILFTYLRKDPKNLKLVLRIIDIWYALGRVDKVFEIVEDYIDKHKGNNNIDTTISSTLNDVSKHLETVCNLRTQAFTVKLDKLRSSTAAEERSNYSIQVVNGK
jgi:hypothetical protein